VGEVSAAEQVSDGLFEAICKADELYNLLSRIHRECSSVLEKDQREEVEKLCALLFRIRVDLALQHEELPWGDEDARVIT